MPDICKQRSCDYLACSDDIYDWFSTLYVKIDEITEPIKISDIYEHFKSSTLYANMSKVDRRKYSLKYFIEKIKTNIFLQKFYRPKDIYINKIRYTMPTLIGFKIITI